MRVLESKKSILDMNGVYTQMRDQFKSWSNDATSFMEGESWLFDDSKIKKNEIYYDLLANNSLDDIVLELLQVVFKSFYILCERLLIDHLPGGIHDQPTEEYRNQVKSVPKTNTVSEMDFAQLDRYLREKPNATTIALESIVLFANNKTREWLMTKTENEKAKIFAAARMMAPKQRKLHQQRRQQIRQYRGEQIATRIAERQAKQKREQTQRSELVQEISVVGLWQSEEVHREIRRIRSSHSRSTN